MGLFKWTLAFNCLIAAEEHLTLDTIKHNFFFIYLFKCITDGWKLNGLIIFFWL